MQLGQERLNQQVKSTDQLPEPRGQWTPPPQPGDYRFRLPKELTSIWDTFDSRDHGKRVMMIFDADAPLTIIQSPGGTHDNEPFETRLNNAPRARGKERILVADLDYLLKALGEKTIPNTNAGYIQALSKHGGRDFAASVEWSWFCNDQREIYVPDGQGQNVKVDGTMGCGARYYQSTIQKVNGEYPLNITCGNDTGTRGICGASVRAFANLTNIRA